jgi:hypothetical protein
MKNTLHRVEISLSSGHLLPIASSQERSATNPSVYIQSNNSGRGTEPSTEPSRLFTKKVSCFILVRLLQSEISGAGNGIRL